MKKVFIEIGGGVAGHLSFLNITGLVYTARSSNETARIFPKQKFSMERLHRRTRSRKFPETT